MSMSAALPGTQGNRWVGLGWAPAVGGVGRQQNAPAALGSLGVYLEGHTQRC